MHPALPTALATVFLIAGAFVAYGFGPAAYCLLAAFLAEATGILIERYSSPLRRR